MKLCLIAIAAAVLFSSCLKQSIADAMISPGGEKNTITATLSYEQNGIPISIKVTDANSQTLGDYSLICEKTPEYYVLSGLSSYGEITDVFYTDSLTAGNYNYNGSFGDRYFLSFNNQAEYVHDAADYFNLTITSYTSGHISGTFTGQLTPLANGSGNTFGQPGSIKITKGVFQNVPVLY